MTEHSLASRRRLREGTSGEGPPVGTGSEPGHQSVVGGMARWTDLAPADC